MGQQVKTKRVNNNLDFGVKVGFGLGGSLPLKVLLFNASANIK